MENLEVVSSVASVALEVVSSVAPESTGWEWLNNYSILQLIIPAIISILAFIVPLIYDHFFRRSKGNEKRMIFILHEILYPILKIKKDFWHEPFVEIYNIQYIVNGLMELLEKHSAFFPKSYTQRIRVLNKNLNRYYIFEDKLTSKDKKKLKKYFNQDCKKIFQVVDMEINRSHRQLGYLYDGFWKNFCVNLKTENRIIPWFICAWLIMAYSAYQIHWEEWGDIGKLIQLIGYFLLFIFLIAFFIYYAYSALISKPEDKYNKLFKKFKNDENMF